MSSSWAHPAGSRRGGGGAIGASEASGWPSGLLVGVIVEGSSQSNKSEQGASTSPPFLSCSPLPSAKPRPRQKQLEGA